MRIIIEPSGGEYIEPVIKRAIEIANLTQTNVIFIGNYETVTVKPGDMLEEVEARWIDKRCK